MKFSENLKNYLAIRGLKQADLCRMAGIQTSLMSDYLGEKKSPTIGNAVAIADALNISLDVLVGKEPRIGRKAGCSKILAQLYEAANDLSEDEQRYILDVIKAMRQHLNKPGNL